MLNLVSPFEEERDNSKTTNDFSGDDYLKILEDDSFTLDRQADKLVDEVNLIVKNNKDTLDNNLTFRLLFNSIKQALYEYKTTSTLFRSYTKESENITNEENIVRILDILREILKERKTTINDIINNLVKIQKLTNDRIKIDKADADEDVDDLLSPDEI